MALIQRVLAPNPGPMTGTGTNTYVLSDGAGKVAVIDPGPTDQRHIAAIRQAAETEGSIVAILVTHHHADHLPGAFPLARETGARLYGHPALPGVQRPLSDGDTWEVGALRLQVMVTPGHTDDSLCVWKEDAHALFTGDLIAGAGTVVVDESPGGLAKYMASLERLERLGPVTIYPGHGPVVDLGAAKVQEYLAHRRMREDQIVGQMRENGPRRVDEIVDMVYPDVMPSLVPMAARNVRAHLDKLEREGRVREERGQWSLIAPPRA